MPYLVDGDNLLGTWPGRSRSDGEKRTLCRQLLRFGRAQRRRVVVVFDGPDPPVPFPTPDAVFSGAGRSADAVIIDRLRAESDPRGWTVVTSDRSLGDQCRWIGARVERSDRFRPRLGDRGGSEKPDDPVDVDEWLEWFGVEDDERP